jgi:tricorn protease interacting factor F2/3
MKNARLDRNVVPSNYKIRIETDLKKFVFKGKVTISAKVAKSTKSIELNSKEMRIKGASVSSKGLAQKGRIKLDPKKESLMIMLSSPVSGAVTIDIEFEGANKDQLHGFYRSSYKYNGKTGYILTTQFEAPDARGALPCFDQPDMKATFDLTLVVDSELEGISNMPVIKTVKLGKGRKELHFDTSPIMSTYLLYIGVGPFEYQRGKYRNVVLRGVTVPGKSKYSKMCIVFAAQFLKYYEDYFGIRYPLPKLDLIAIPDFEAGAMENWGAITFREGDMLGNEKVTGIAIRQRIAEVIAHELAHQWFGNLVTMDWWDDIWLNESFATLMAYKAMDSVYPEWRKMEEYAIDTIDNALAADSVKSSIPIKMVVTKTEDMGALASPAIYYDKGGSILNMMEDYIGKENFRKGLQGYLRKHAYGNATRDDLWEALDKFYKSDWGLKGVASYWIDNPGYPIVTIKEEGSSIKLSQDRFLISGSMKHGNWPIPMHYATESSGVGKTLRMNKKTASINKRLDWIKLNYGQKGFYRVRYPERMLEALAKEIEKGKFSGVDVWGIENDLFALVRSGYIEVDTYLTFLKSCLGADYPARYSVMGHLGWLNYSLYGKRLSEKSVDMAARFYRKRLDELGWEPKKRESSIETIERSMVLGGLGINGDPQVVSRLTQMFEDYVKTGKKIDPNISGAVYGVVAWNHNEKYRAKLFELLEKTEMADEQRKLQRAISMFSDSSLLVKSMDYSLTGKIKPQDAFFVPLVVSRNKIGKDIVLDWYMKNWGKLMKMYPKDISILGLYCITAFDCLYDQKSKDKLSKFFRDKKNWRSNLKRPFDDTVEEIDANINFMKANGIN